MCVVTAAFQGDPCLADNNGVWVKHGSTGMLSRILIEALCKNQRKENLFIFQGNIQKDISSLNTKQNEIILKTKLEKDNDRSGFLRNRRIVLRL